MSGCQSAVEYVYQYIDDELTFARRVMIRWHLRRCGRCVDAFTFESDLKARIAEAGRAAPSEQFLTTLRTLIADERARHDTDR